MKFLISIAIVLSAFGANADIIKCSFTEPFVDFQYSMTQSTLTVTDNIVNTKTTKKAVSLQILGAAHFELWDSNNIAVAILTLDYQGSDGMSDAVYPYSAVWNSPVYGTLYGGCTSNHQPALSLPN